MRQKAKSKKQKAKSKKQKVLGAKATQRRKPSLPMALYPRSSTSRPTNEPVVSALGGAVVSPPRIIYMTFMTKTCFGALSST